MPLVKKPHGGREMRHILAELTLPKVAYKKRQAIIPLRDELARKDATFRRDIAKIRHGMTSGSLSAGRANELYYTALDAAIRRRRGKAA